jgi:hypothetical protein
MQTCTNQTTSWLVCSWSTFGARMNHGHSRTHNIHHGLNLGEATTFPLIIFFGRWATMQIIYLSTLLQRPSATFLCVLCCRNPTLGLRMQLTLPKVGKWSPPGLPKTQKIIWGVKSPCIGAFFISMEMSWSVHAQNGLAWAIWTSAAQVMGKSRVGSQTSSLTPDH